MKITLIAQEAVGSPYITGIGHYAKSLICALLDRKNMEYDILLFDYNNERGNYSRAKQFFGKYNVPINVCSTFDYRRLRRPELGFPSEKLEDITEINGDIVHYFSIFFSPLKTDKKQIFTIHDLGMYIYPDFWYETDRKTGLLCIKHIENSASAVIADSESTKREIEYYTDIDINRVDVVYPSYDDKAVFQDTSDMKDTDISKNDKYFLYIGLVINKKNIIRMIEAFEIVCKTDNVKLVISGFAPDLQETKDILNRINSSCISDRIIFTEYITDERKRQLYSNAVCFIYPTLHEGFGIPVLEAQACGCPVISSNVASLPEVAADTTILFDPYDVDALACEMKRILTDDSLRSNLMKKGYENIKRFSWDKAAGQVEQIYEKMLSKK